MRQVLRIFGFSLLVLGWLGTSASAQAEETSSVGISIVQEQEAVRPGEPFTVALQMAIPKGWHGYWKNPGEAGMPISVDWNLPDGWEAGELEWPTPEKFSFESITGYGYEGETTFLATITPPQNLEEGTTHAIGGTATWLICSDTTCFPGQTVMSKEVTVTHGNPADGANQKIFSVARERMAAAHGDVEVTREGDVIKIVAKNLAGVNADALDFYPENSTMVDGKEPPMIAQHDASSGETIVVLPDAVGNHVPADELRGLLVIDKQRAVAIVAPIQAAVNGGGGVDAAGFAGDVDLQQSYGWILLLAFAGGMLLNLMPCVLPVLSFKVLSFIRMAGQSRALTFKHGISFSLGVLMSFWVLAGVMLTLQAYGSAVGWGFQLQDPLFVAILAGILFVFSLSLFGVFEVGTSVASYAGQSSVKSAGTEGLTSSFLSGVLATAIATPCTGPFLGTAVGFAFTVAAPKAMLIFTSLGFGMAFPYLLLSGFPKLLRFMPKPGTWMVVFKEVMGFMLLATVLWLVWVFGMETDMMAVSWLLVGFLSFAIGCWIYGKWTTPMSKKLSRSLAYVFTAFFFLAGGYITYSSIQEAAANPGASMVVHGDWKRFAPEEVDALRKEGTPVFVDFTAEWCLSCKANHLVLDSASVTGAFADMNVVKMKADWTKRDPVVTEALRRHGRNSIPLYVLYLPGEKEPIILPQVLTPEIVNQALHAHS